MKLLIQTERLILLPFTLTICRETINKLTSTLEKEHIIPGQGWPDEETLDTLPRIIKNLEKVPEPSGFESWMVIEHDTNFMIGDIGFKGLPNECGEVDLGYGIIENYRKKGFALEAANALVNWALAKEAVRAITANCSVDNFASQKILQALNFNKIKEEKGMFYWRLNKYH